MKFVLGSPIEDGPAVWYIKLVSQEEREFVSRILEENERKFLADPHKSLESSMCANASGQLAVNILGDARKNWFVNHSGGMCPELFNIEKELDVDHWPELKDRISTSQWPGGKHWYARIDGDDIKDEDGCNKKFDIKQDAQFAADKVLRKKIK